MEISEDLKIALEKNLSQINHEEIIKKAQNISKQYRENDGTGRRFVKEENEAISYALSRMPSTYCVTVQVLKELLKFGKDKIKSLIDVGAGTGAATWGAKSILDIKDIKCLERESSMISIGSKLMQEDKVLKNAKWIKTDVLIDSLDLESDLVITSYMINELDEKNRPKVIEKLWKMTKKILVIIEPGTPEGFRHIKQARKMLLENGAYIVSPCATQGECNLNEDDWCSFSVRVARSKIQKETKNGVLAYEDEKFSYIIFSREKETKCISRILRHPQIGKGFIKLKLCTQNGIIEKTFSKKDGEKYKKARKLGSGDII